MSERIRGRVAQTSEELVDYRRRVLELHPDFEEVHWARRTFFRRLPRDLKSQEVRILTMMIENKMYFEMLNFLHLYKNPVWFMTLSLTVFASHKLWFLLFLFLLISSHYVRRLIKREENEKLMKVNTKMSDVKVIFIVTSSDSRASTTSRKNSRTSSTSSKTPSLTSKWGPNCPRGCCWKAPPEWGRL